MSFQGLQERLSQLQETTAQLRSLIDRLANLELQPGSVPLPVESFDDAAAAALDGNVVSELGADITQGLREADEELELLREEIEDLRRGRPGSEAAKSKARLKDASERLDQELKADRIAFRKAQLSARQKLAAAQRAERAVLLASYATAPAGSVATTRSNASSPGPQQQQQQQAPSLRRRPQKHERATDNDKAVGAAHDVTEALRRTHDMMASELARSAYAAQALAESTATLRSLDERYTNMDAMLATTRGLLRTLARSQKSDSWYLRTTLYVLLATLAWLVFRRLLYGPLWWLLWLPLRAAWWSASKGVGGGVALVGRAGGRGGEARMEVAGTSGSPTIVGMAGDGSVPTASVAYDKSAGVSDSGPSDSMVDEVGKIIDGDVGSSDAPYPSSGDQDSQPPNPKKRMWEEPVAEAKESSPSDGEGDHAERARNKDEL